MAIFDEKIEIRERCKGVHCVDLGESFPTSIYLMKSASIQPRTSPSKFAGKFNSIFIRLLKDDDGDDADAAVISAGDAPDADKISASDAPDADDEHMTNGPQKAMGDLLRGKADAEGGDSEGAPETKGVDSAEESTPDEGKVAAAPDADAGAAGEEADGNAMAGMKQLMGALGSR